MLLFWRENFREWIFLTEFFLIWFTTSFTWYDESKIKCKKAQTQFDCLFLVPDPICVVCVYVCGVDLFSSVSIECDVYCIVQWIKHFIIYHWMWDSEKKGKNSFSTFFLSSFRMQTKSRSGFLCVPCIRLKLTEMEMSMTSKVECTATNNNFSSKVTLYAYVSFLFIHQKTQENRTPFCIAIHQLFLDCSIVSVCVCLVESIELCCHILLKRFFHSSAKTADVCLLDYSRQ